MKWVTLPLALLVLVTLAPIAGASPSTIPVCGTCGALFADAAADHGVDVTVAESTVTVRIHEDGSATWTVRNRLSDGADRFREDPSLLGDVAPSSMAEPIGVGYSGVRFKSARMDGDTAVLEYRDSDAAERHGGMLVVDYLHHGGSAPRYHVNADTFTIRGPEGTVVSNDPASGTVEGGSVTWDGSTAENWHDAPRVEEYPYVVFGPDESAATTVQTTAAVSLASVPFVLEAAILFLVVQTVTFAAVLWSVVVALRRRRRDVETAALVTGVLVVAVLGVVLLFQLFGREYWLLVGSMLLSELSVFTIVLASLVWHSPTRRHLRTPRELAAAAAAGLVVAHVVLAAGYAVTGRGDPTTLPVLQTALALPFAAMLPLGGVLDGDERSLRKWIGVATLTFATFSVTVVSVAWPVTGAGVGLVALLTFLTAILFPVVGAPVVATGWELSRDGPAEQSSDHWLAT